MTIVEAVLTLAIGIAIGYILRGLSCKATDVTNRTSRSRPRVLRRFNPEDDATGFWRKTK